MVAVEACTVPRAVGVGELLPALSDQPAEWLESEVCTLAGHIAAATSRLLALVGELDRRETWRTWECRSMAHWLSWKAGMSLRTAREHVRVAAALGDLPATAAAFAAGRLSYAKVRAITRCATAKTDPLVDVALHATGAQMERIAAGYNRAERLADADRGAEGFRRRGIWSRFDDDGTATLVVRGSPDEIRRVLDAARAVTPSLPEPADAADTTPAARRYDAFMEVVERGMHPSDDDAPVPGPAPRPDTELVVHADVQAVAGEPGRIALDDGGPLTHATLARLACDCGIRVLLAEGGRTIDVGRRSRRVSSALSRLVHDRDGGTCRFPGCTNRGRLQIHHRRHWSQGGSTSADNLFLVCRYHHKVLHEGGWHAKGDADGRLAFHHPCGRVVPEVAPPPPATDPGALRRAHALAGLAMGPDTVTGRWDGAPLELAWTVDLLWDADPPVTRGGSAEPPARGGGSAEPPDDRSGEHPVA